MNTEFNWWLLIVGLAIGAGVVWLILSITRRDELDVTERERESEARWIGEAMRHAGRRLDDMDVLDVLRLHESYLAAPPPDEVEEDDADPAWGVAARSGHEARAPMAHPIGSPEPIDGGRSER